MELLTELWREISLLLPRHHLAVNKEFIAFYDEKWYRDKILSQYPTVKKHDNSWEYLYKRSLKSGKIFGYGNDGSIKQYPYDIEGIAIAPTRYRCQMILTINGDLYHNDQNKIELLDNNVTAITTSSYIKGDEWYHYEFNLTLITKSEEQFINVVTSEEEEWGAITANYFYYYCDYDNVFITVENKGNVKLINNGPFIVLDNEGIIKRFDYHTRSLIKLPLPRIRKLYPKYVETINGNLLQIYDEIVDINYLFRSKKLEIIDKKLNSFILKSNNFDIELVLIGTDLFLCKSATTPVLLHSNVKSVCGLRYFIV